MVNAAQIGAARLSAPNRIIRGADGLWRIYGIANPWFAYQIRNDEPLAFPIVNGRIVIGKDMPPRRTFVSQEAAVAEAVRRGLAYTLD